MPVKDLKELFVLLLSELRRGAERSRTIFREFGQVTQDPEIREALQAGGFVPDKTLNTLDECFHMIGEVPVNPGGRIRDILESLFLDTFVADFRRELAEIQCPEARRLFILARANGLIHVRIGECEALIATAEVTGHCGVGVLLENCLAEALAFEDRLRLLIREQLRQRLAA
jgi:hypothetical protein